MTGEPVDSINAVNPKIAVERMVGKFMTLTLTIGLAQHVQRFSPQDVVSARCDPLSRGSTIVEKHQPADLQPL